MEKNATVLRAMNAAAQGPCPEGEPARATDRETALAASSDKPISVLVRQLIRPKKTPRKTST